MKKYAFYAVIVLVSVVAVGFAVNAFVGTEAPKVVVEGDYIEAQGGESLGAISGPDVYGDFRVLGEFKHKVGNTEVAQTLATSTVTLTSEDSGTTYFLSATGTNIVLPAVGFIGTNFKFIVNGAMATENMKVKSAEGDNINGTLTVNNADVVCDAEDQINFVVDGEELGDTVSLLSDGSQWLIVGSDATTAAKITCTDPS